MTEGFGGLTDPRGEAEGLTHFWRPRTFIICPHAATALLTNSKSTWFQDFCVKTCTNKPKAGGGNDSHHEKNASTETSLFSIPPLRCYLQAFARHVITRDRFCEDLFPRGKPSLQGTRF